MQPHALLLPERMRELELIVHRARSKEQYPDNAYAGLAEIAKRTAAEPVWGAEVDIRSVTNIPYGRGKTHRYRTRVLWHDAHLKRLGNGQILTEKASLKDMVGVMQLQEALLEFPELMFYFDPKSFTYGCLKSRKGDLLPDEYMRTLYAGIAQDIKITGASERALVISPKLEFAEVAKQWNPEIHICLSLHNKGLSGSALRLLRQEPKYLSGIASAVAFPHGQLEQALVEEFKQAGFGIIGYKVEKPAALKRCLQVGAIPVCRYTCLPTASLT